jgi:hypothetical protein
MRARIGVSPKTITREERGTDNRCRRSIQRIQLLALVRSKLHQSRARLSRTARSAMASLCAATSSSMVSAPRLHFSVRWMLVLNFSAWRSAPARVAPDDADRYQTDNRDGVCLRRPRYQSSLHSASGRSEGSSCRNHIARRRIDVSLNANRFKLGGVIALFRSGPGTQAVTSAR